jgi:hypothetical protein
MNFVVAFYDPFKPYIVQLGEMEQVKVIDTFQNIPWEKFLSKMEGKKPNEIYYSPSLDIENKEDKRLLTVSIVGKPAAFEYYIFYRRAKTVKTFFGLAKKEKQNYMTEIRNQTYTNALNCLNAFLKNDTDFLENKIP